MNRKRSVKSPRLRYCGRFTWSFGRAWSSGRSQARGTSKIRCFPSRWIAKFKKKKNTLFIFSPAGRFVSVLGVRTYCGWWTTGGGTVRPKTSTWIPFCAGVKSKTSSKTKGRCRSTRKCWNIRKAAEKPWQHREKSRRDSGGTNETRQCYHPMRPTDISNNYWS